MRTQQNKAQQNVKRKPKIAEQMWSQFQDQSPGPVWKSTRSGPFPGSQKQIQKLYKKQDIVLPKNYKDNKTKPIYLKPTT